MPPYLKTHRYVVVGVIAIALMSAGIATATADVATSTDSTSSMSSSTPDVTDATSTAIESPDTLTSSTTPSVATSTLVTCTTAYTSDLYDTPSGHLDSNTLATSTDDIGSNIAHITGTQSWADCTDSQGNAYEIKLSPEEYSALGQPGAVMPKKLLLFATTSISAVQ